jgi:hypothetical protein|tara:strand:+ start:3837 stop:4004 length:168 start_codon:yes stop_codon:yes gene_type:complete
MVSPSSVAGLFRKWLPSITDETGGVSDFERLETKKPGLRPGFGILERETGLALTR